MAMYQSTSMVSGPVDQGTIAKTQKLGSSLASAAPTRWQLPCQRWFTRAAGAPLFFCWTPKHPQVTSWPPGSAGMWVITVRHAQCASTTPPPADGIVQDLLLCSYSHTVASLQNLHLSCLPHLGLHQPSTGLSSVNHEPKCCSEKPLPTTRATTSNCYKHHASTGAQLHPAGQVHVILSTYHLPLVHCILGGPYCHVSHWQVGPALQLSSAVGQKSLQAHGLCWPHHSHVIDCKHKVALW